MKITCLFCKKTLNLISLLYDEELNLICSNCKKVLITSDPVKEKSIYSGHNTYNKKPFYEIVRN